MNIIFTPTKQIYANPKNGYRVLSCRLVGGEDADKIELDPQWGNFKVAGYNLFSYVLGNSVSAKVSPDTNNKYKGTYSIVGIPGLSTEGEDIIIDRESEYSILSSFMTPGQATNVLKAYPDFAQMILRNKEDDIDYKKIYGVGPVYLKKYIEQIKKRCTYLLFYPLCNKWNIIDDKDIQLLANIYNIPANLDDAFKEDPYHILMDILKQEFKKADKNILSKFPELNESLPRAQRYCEYELKKNEYEGDTKLQAQTLANIIKQDAPELVPFIVDAVIKNPRIYYDKVSGYCSIQATYDEECNIAENILYRIHNSESLNLNYEDFKEVDGFECTEEQMKISQLANENNIAMLTGGAGCVDCDTEFFNGEKWRRIADYTPDDLVLQYNYDGSANLVKPLNYIKQPCDTLWHFETKYGINQTVCNDHRIIYWSQKGKQYECTISEIINKQNSSSKWKGLFKTNFYYEGKGITLTDAEIKIMCAVICVGSFTHSKDTTLCRFHIKKDRKKEKLREIFTEANIKWREKESATEGYTDFHIYAPLRTKEFTKEWYNCTNHQLQVICDNILFWDGSTSTTKNNYIRKTFSTTNKVNADFIQFAFSSCGYRCSINIYDRKGQNHYTNNKVYKRISYEYNLTITNRTMVGLCADNRPNHTPTIPVQVPTQDGYKYCFTVPSHMLVLRRNNNIFITGNCGKTTSVKALVRMLEANGFTYTLLAPTGIAAKRMKESTGREAMTIHMFIALGGRQTDYVIIDEFSMVSVHLFSELLSIIGKNPRLVFVCDEAQLASIDCGNIVQDIIDSGIVPTAKLTKVFRYGVGGISTVSTDIRTGTPIDMNKKWPDCKFVSTGTDPIEAISEQYKYYINHGYKKEDVLILCPYKVGNFGTYKINNRIQEEFNTNPPSSVSYNIGGSKTNIVNFRLGDKVINSKNNYRMVSANFDEKTGELSKTYFADTGEELEYPPIPIMNGDIGYIIAIKEDKENGILDTYVQFEQGIAVYSYSEIENLMLGYAISIHKSQGCESKAVIVAIGKNHERMLTRNLLYVGVSRAKEELIIISDEGVVNNALDKEENKVRDTWLKELLLEEYKNEEDC